MIPGLAMIIVLIALPGATCPPCSHFEMWTATPCSPYNCSPCGFCSYCCFRYDIGCEHCLVPVDDDISLTSMPEALPMTPMDQAPDLELPWQPAACGLEQAPLAS
jgi:hypothetical protein